MQPKSLCIWKPNLDKNLTNTIRLTFFAIQSILSNISPERLCAIFGRFTNVSIMTQCNDIVDMEVKAELSAPLPSSSSPSSPLLMPSGRCSEDGGWVSHQPPAVPGLPPKWWQMPQATTSLLAHKYKYKYQRPWPSLLKNTNTKYPDWNSNLLAKLLADWALCISIAQLRANKMNLSFWGLAKL